MFRKFQSSSSGTAVKFCSVKNSVPMKRQGIVGPSSITPIASACRRSRSVENAASTKRVCAVARSSKQNTFLGSRFSSERKDAALLTLSGDSEKSDCAEVVLRVRETSKTKNTENG